MFFFGMFFGMFLLDVFGMFMERNAPNWTFEAWIRTWCWKPCVDLLQTPWWVTSWCYSYYSCYVRLHLRSNTPLQNPTILSIFTDDFPMKRVDFHGFHGQVRFPKWKVSQLPWSNNDQSTSQPVKAQMKSRTFLVGPEAGGVFVDRESMDIFHKLSYPVWWTIK
jgi:hypothetical protein